MIKIYFMEYRKFERHIANTLYHDKVDLDVNTLIQDIHGNKKKDHKVVFFLIFSGIVMMVLIAGIYYFASDIETKSKIEKTNLSEITLANIDFSKNRIAESSERGINRILENTSSYISEDTIMTNVQNKRGNHGPTFSKKILLTENTIIKNEELKMYSETLNSTSINENIIDNILSEQDAVEQINLLPNIDFKTLVFKTNFGLKTDKVVCPNFSNRKKLLFEIIPEVGLLHPIKKLENGFNEENKIFSLRNADEKSLEGINAGLYLMLRREKLPLYLKAGMSWSKFTERMQLAYSYTRKDTTQGIISITYSQSGDTITAIIGDIITERRLSGNKTRHHAFSLWDIPVSLGLEKNFGSWFVGVEAGLNINLSVKSEGNILASDTSFINVNEPQNHFRSSLGLSYFGGVQFGRDFQRNGRVFLAVRGRVIPTSFNSEANLIKQKYQLIGINLGYVWSF